MSHTGNARPAECVRANPNPGPSIFHDFDCTHDPCRCISSAAKRAASKHLQAHLLLAAACVVNSIGVLLLALKELYR